MQKTKRIPDTDILFLCVFSCKTNLNNFKNEIIRLNKYFDKNSVNKNMVFHSFKTVNMMINFTKKSLYKSQEKNVLLLQ